MHHSLTEVRGFGFVEGADGEIGEDDGGEGSGEVGEGWESEDVGEGGGREGGREGHLRGQ